MNGEGLVYPEVQIGKRSTPSSVFLFWARFPSPCGRGLGGGGGLATGKQLPEPPWVGDPNRGSIVGRQQGPVSRDQNVSLALERSAQDLVIV